jgi:hypothetical protein
VLTSEQYIEFQKGGQRTYWRDTLLSVLKMIDLVIIGYSATDPNFQDQLERAKQIASPNHPVFMFAAGLELSKVRELYRDFNIRVLPYNNEDGTHRELRRLLARYDPFIAKRGTNSVGLEPVDETAATLAFSIHLFTQLRIADQKDLVIENAYKAVVTQILADTGGNEWVPIDKLRDSLAKKTFASTNVDPIAFERAIDSLYQLAIIGRSNDTNSVALEFRGRELVARLTSERKLLREKFHTTCKVFLSKEYPTLQNEAIDKIIENIGIGLVHAFEKRGLEIARSIFLSGKLDVSDATDILQTLNEGSASLSTDSERMAYADLMIEVMLRPSVEMREYLGALSQGYFAFHGLGLEPRCSQERLNMAKEQLWIMDSSVLLPLVAKDCLNHKYALDLLDRMKQAGFRRATTERLFDEVKEHAWWAITNFSKVPMDSPGFLLGAMAGPGYKLNLFFGWIYQMVCG